MSTTQVDEEELNALTDITMCHSDTMATVGKLQLCADSFANPVNRAAFNVLMALPKEATDAECLTALKKDPSTVVLVKDHQAADAFLGHFKSIAHCAHDLVTLARGSAIRRALQEIITLFNNRNIDPHILPGELDTIKNELDRQLTETDRYVAHLEKTVSPDEIDGTRPMPEELMHVPGFIDALTKYTCSVAYRPNRVLAFSGALAALSFLVGRKFTDTRGTMPNLYIIALANSGVGKEAPREVNKRLEGIVETDGVVGDAFSSGQGLEDALFAHPRMLYQMDEFDTFLNSLKSILPETEAKYKMILNLFSESRTVHYLRDQAMTREEKQRIADNPTLAKQKKRLKIINPSLTLFGTAIPDKFYTSLSPRALDNGLLARCLIFEAGKRGAMGKGPYETPFPRDIAIFVQTLANADNLENQRLNPKFTVVPDANADVDDAIKQAQKTFDPLYDQAVNKKDSAGMSVWNRGPELVNKLSLLYALSENLISPKVTVAGVNWATKVVHHSLSRMLAMAASYVCTDELDAKINKVLRYVRESKNGVSRSKLGHELHLNKKDIDVIEETLVERRQIKVTIGAYSKKRYTALDTTAED